MLLDVLVVGQCICCCLLSLSSHRFPHRPKLFSCTHPQTAVHVVSRHTSRGYIAPAATGIFIHPVAANKHDCTRVCTQDKIITIVAIKDVIQKFCGPFLYMGIMTAHESQHDFAGR